EHGHVLRQEVPRQPCLLEHLEADVVDGRAVRPAQVAGDAYAEVGHHPATTGFVRRPIRSTSTVTSSPGTSHGVPSRNAATPAGVPVETTSPGTSVTIPVRNSIRRGTGKSMSLVDEFCRSSPFTSVRTRSCDGSGISSSVTISGPIGQNV